MAALPGSVAQAIQKNPAFSLSILDRLPFESSGARGGIRVVVSRFFRQPYSSGDEKSEYSDFVTHFPLTFSPTRDSRPVAKKLTCDVALVDLRRAATMQARKTR